jgi:chorismate dehydratase
MRVGRIPYINCYPVYGAIDRGLVTLDATLVDGTPSELNARIARGDLDISVVSAVEYARDSSRYVLLPDSRCRATVRCAASCSFHVTPPRSWRGARCS